MMNPRVKQVKPKEDYLLELEFNNGEQRVFDMKPYLNFGVFKALQAPGIFYTARATDGTVHWQNEADLCPDTLYMESKPIG